MRPVLPIYSTLIYLCGKPVTGFVMLGLQRHSTRIDVTRRSLSSSPSNGVSNDERENDKDILDRTTFDQAGASLIEEEDRKRLEAMGDFDSNPTYQTETMERMRAAIRERTAQLGMEKSKVSAAYIQQRQEQAEQLGAQMERESSSASVFGGVDLSKITSDASRVPASNSRWDEDMPSMFYDPEDDLTLEERQEVDPMMTKNVVDQALNELSNAKWPTFAAAGREVVVMAIVVACSAALIIGADNLLRVLYTDLGFIPSNDDIANYASRFDGLGLPEGWMNNMNEQDVAKLADAVNADITKSLPSTSSLPSL